MHVEFSLSRREAEALWKTYTGPSPRKTQALNVAEFKLFTALAAARASADDALNVEAGRAPAESRPATGTDGGSR